MNGSYESNIGTDRLVQAFIATNSHLKCHLLPVDTLFPCSRPRPVAIVVVMVVHLIFVPPRGFLFDLFTRDLSFAEPSLTTRAFCPPANEAICSCTNGCKDTDSYQDRVVIDESLHY